MSGSLLCGCDPSTVKGPRCAAGHALQKDVRETWDAWTGSLKRKMPAKTRAEFRQLYFEAREKMNAHYSEQEAA